MSKPVFKEGDRVVFVDTYADWRGKEAVILEATSRVVIVRRSDGKIGNFYASRFRPLPNTPFDRDLQAYLSRELPYGD